MRAAGEACEKTMPANNVRGHVHTCIGKHTPRDKDHFCGECRTRWWES